MKHNMPHVWPQKPQTCKSQEEGHKWSVKTSDESMLVVAEANNTVEITVTQGGESSVFILICCLDSWSERLVISVSNRRWDMDDSFSFIHINTAASVPV